MKYIEQFKDMLILKETIFKNVFWGDINGSELKAYGTWENL